MIESQPTEIEIFLPEREKKVAAAVGMLRLETVDKLLASPVRNQLEPG